MRAALYFAPPAGHPLTVAASVWLGRDAWTGDRPIRAPVPGFAADEIDRLTAEPRRYGFHATLKPPFRFREGRGIDGLRTAVGSFAETRMPVPIAALRLERLGPFFALTPDGDVPDLNGLADDVVRAFDAFRAPPTEEEVARRRPERLTPREREHLAAWGYPYVFDAFRFHMTLTGPVPEDRRDAMEAALAERFADFIGRPLAVDRLCVFVEADPPGDFAVDRAAVLGHAGG